MRRKKYWADKEVAERYGVGPSTIWRWVANGIFPEPTKISPGCTRWNGEKLDEHDSKLEGHS